MEIDHTPKHIWCIYDNRKRPVRRFTTRDEARRALREMKEGTTAQLWLGRREVSEQVEVSS